jgi:hypothetical protein
MNLAEYREVRLDGDMCPKRLRDSVRESDGKGREGQCRGWEKGYLQFLRKRRGSCRSALSDWAGAKSTGSNITT